MRRERERSLAPGAFLELLGDQRLGHPERLGNGGSAFDERPQRLADVGGQKGLEILERGRMKRTILGIETLERDLEWLHREHQAEQLEHVLEASSERRRKM